MVNSPELALTGMFSEVLKPLLNIENGKQEAMPVPCNKENSVKFRKALQIWIFKPQVVDRRILCGSVLRHAFIPREALTMADSTIRLKEVFLKNLQIEQQKRNPYVRHISTDFSDGIEEADAGLRDFPTNIHNQITTSSRFEDGTSDVVLGSDYEPELEEENEVGVVLIKVLPRQSDRMKSFHQIVLLDYLQNEAFFIRLNSGTSQPQIPEDPNQSWSYKISWDVHSQGISITTSEYYEHHHPVKALPELTPPTKEWLFSTLLPKLCKWTSEINPELPLHVKKSVISMERYSKVHAQLKIKYADKFVKTWTESTDPQKYVYEDISIAAYLIVLWEEERERKHLINKQSFVDLGCGNGLLVHILSSEGHPGKGIDLRRRKIWDLYGHSTILEENTIIPGKTGLTEDYDWLIGNHSDELTPWIPVMAFRSSPNTRYFVLPCCFFDFDKKYNKTEANTTQYRSYLNFMQEIGHVCGYEVEEDNLRIPSTKRVCQIGMKVRCDEMRTLTNDQIDWYIQTRSVQSGLESCKISKSFEEYLQTKNCDSPSSEGTSKWSEQFEPRQKVEPVRNCSSLSDDLKETIVTKVFLEILSAEKSDKVKGQETKRLRKWSKGGVIKIRDAVSLFESDVLKQLKQECGGLKTLLKNHYQIFHVVGDEVRIRDWSNLESSLPKSSSKNKYKDSNRREEKYKTKLCWFDSHHPEGCPRESADCPFAHGQDDLRTCPSETVVIVDQKVKGV